MPQSSGLNYEVVGDQDTISAHVFFLPGAKTSIADMQYWQSICCKWDRLCEVIKTDLEKEDKGLQAIRLGVLNQAGVMPELKPIDYFFSSDKSFRQGKKVMILVVSSNTECKTAGLFV